MLIRYGIQTRSGKSYLSDKQMRQAEDFNRTHAKDMLQPTRYNSADRKMEINPDFAKAYGNPFNKKAEIGTAVDKAIDSGEIELKDGESN